MVGLRLIRVFVFASMFTTVVIIIRIVLHNKFHDKRTTTSVKNIIWNEAFVVPNIVHFIFFNKELDFPSLLSIVSVLKIQHPEQLLIHSDIQSFSGKYWTILQSLSSAGNLSIELRYLSQPTHVFGQILSSIYHATDVARIQVLMEWGGIYLDSDMVLIKCLDKFRHYEMVVGWPDGQYIGTQILMAKRNAQFLSMWLEGYRRYLPRDWYFNAGQYPTEQILMKHRGIAHSEPIVLGVHNLLDKLYGESPWSEWRQFSAIHLLSRHWPAPQHLNENFIHNYSAPFGELARWLLFDLEPRVNFNTISERV